MFETAGGNVGPLEKEVNTRQEDVRSGRASARRNAVLPDDPGPA